MPEGDTVWLAAKRLDEALGGHLLTASDFRVPQLATVDLADHRVTDVRSYGKHLLMHIESPASQAFTLHSHLKMEGSWHLYTPTRPWRGGPTHQIRVVLRTAGMVAIGYRVTELSLVPTDAEHGAFLAHLGPDILGADFDFDLALARLQSAPERPLAEALLDQRVVAGLGMNYVAEVCFLTGAHPLCTVESVDAEAVLALAVRLLQGNRGRASRITTGRSGRGASSWVHGRRTCLRCGSRLHASELGAPTERRRIVWCPQCQGPPQLLGIPT